MSFATNSEVVHPLPPVIDVFSKDVKFNSLDVLRLAIFQTLNNYPCLDNVVCNEWSCVVSFVLMSSNLG